MTRRFFLFILGAFLLTPLIARAQTRLGGFLITLPYNASKLLADPGRSRVYAAIPDSDGVVVINTTTLQVVGVVPSGQNPVDLAISPDGNTLYVANSGHVSISGPLAGAVGVVDLRTLTLRASYGLPGPASAIAAGLDGRVYVTATSLQGQESVICQLDGATGTIQTTFASMFDNLSRLQITPDGTTLFATTADGEPGELCSFDVATPTPAPRQTLRRIGADSKGLTISHNGKLLGLTQISYLSDEPQTYTDLLSSTDLDTVTGSILFDDPERPRSLAFSPDDSLLYQIHGAPYPMLGVYDTQTSTSTAQVPVPMLDRNGSDTFGSLVIDHSGTYAFITDSYWNGSKTIGVINVVGTGKGTLPAPLPTLNLTGTALDGTISGQGDQQVVTVFRTGEPTQKLVVNYSLAGTARNGVDYALLSGKKTIKAGQVSATITIRPIAQQGETATRTVKLALQSGADYQLGPSKKVKLKLPANQ